jgi:hypothetical protein
MKTHFCHNCGDVDVPKHIMSVTQQQLNNLNIFEITDFKLKFKDFILYLFDNKAIYAKNKTELLIEINAPQNKIFAIPVCNQCYSIPLQIDFIKTKNVAPIMMYAAIKSGNKEIIQKIYEYFETKLSEICQNGNSAISGIIDGNNKNNVLNWITTQPCCDEKTLTNLVEYAALKYNNTNNNKNIVKITGEAITKYEIPWQTIKSVKALGNLYHMFNNMENYENLTEEIFQLYWRKTNPEPF